ncbi:MAG: hypothetical protein GXO75_08285 [Calditrichaeota bacterium]|nr:hypothetical protein [Calditrichota bacterium]
MKRLLEMYRKHSRHYDRGLCPACEKETWFRWEMDEFTMCGVYRCCECGGYSAVLPTEMCDFRDHFGVSAEEIFRKEEK